MKATREDSHICLIVDSTEARKIMEVYAKHKGIVLEKDWILKLRLPNGYNTQLQPDGAIQ